MAGLHQAPVGKFAMFGQGCMNPSFHAFDGPTCVLWPKFLPERQLVLGLCDSPIYFVYCDVVVAE